MNLVDFLFVHLQEVAHLGATSLHFIPVGRKKIIYYREEYYEPYVKYWRSALQKAKINKPRKITTPDECAQQKVRMAESLLKSAFERESKLLLAEFQRPDYVPTMECNAHMTNLFNTHLDKLFANCVKDYIYLCVFNYFSALKIKRESANDAQKAFILRPYEEDTLGRIKEDLAKMLIFFYKVRDNISGVVSEMVNDRQEKADKIADLLKMGGDSYVTSVTKCRSPRN